LSFPLIPPVHNMQTHYYYSIIPINLRKAFSYLT
jgi:hypothetical protein